jgi:A/G-specific adenine glycosylase
VIAVTTPRPKFAAAAIAWFTGNQRDLPWRRRDTTPWGVLVSEVMLQQTPVVRVLPAWQAWMARWPHPADLAADPVAEAIRAWDRLGYPRRAMRLHACATAITTECGGQVPDDVATLLSLPGIGTYTAHAVAAFAYRQRHPVVDTNVRRVVARAVGGQADAGDVTTSADLRATEALLPADAELAAQASAAFMEIGAVLCTARAPRCAECPLRSMCAWRALGVPLPTTPSRRRQTYAGTERQIRGALLATLRQSAHPVDRARLDLSWPEPDRRDRALATLVADGLVTEISAGLFTLGSPAGLGSHAG